MLKPRMPEVTRNVWLNGFISWHLSKKNWKKGHFFLATKLSHTHTHRRDNKNVSEEALEDLFCPLKNVSYAVAPRADLCKLS